MKKLIALTHVAFEDLGYFKEIFEDAGFTISYVEAPIEDLNRIEKVDDPDLLVVLGGPIGVNQEDRYPFLTNEIRLVEKRIRNNRPTLGICLGGQIMAKALGAAVSSATSKEIGWFPLVMTDAGKSSSLQHLSKEHTKVFHWHGDYFDIPAGAALLAFSTACPYQAFSYNTHALALQFHPKVTKKQLEKWYVGHAAELEQNPQLSLLDLRREAQKWESTLKKQGELFLRQWIGEAFKNNS